MKCLLLWFAAAPLFAQTKSIPIAELKDRIRGGWAGQMIGVSYGAPTEFRFNEQIIPKEKLPVWTPEKITNSLNQDDLYVDMTFAKVLDEKGLDATVEDFGAMFKDARYSLWHANLAARRNLKRGVPPKLAGHPDYNLHADDIDFQIESDFIGLMAPGLPRAAVDIATRAGRVMNYGEGIYGGVFVSCMYSAAFLSSDPRSIVEAGYACLPRQSKYAQVIGDLLVFHKQEPRRWEAAWQQLEQKWNRAEPCPQGALKPFNIDAALNGAYIALGLLYGDGDFSRTIEISTRAGQDSDCNPSSAAGILGVMLGYERIPDAWKSGIGKISNEKFRYTDFTFETIVDSTLARTIQLVTRNGGKRDGGNLLIRTQLARAAPLEVWKGRATPNERIPLTDARWKLEGNWREVRDARIAADKGASATVTFEGTGIALTGPFLPTCGKAEVTVDDRPAKVVDCYPDEQSRKNGESLFHVFGLGNGRHTVRLRVLGESIFDSTGTDVSLAEAILYQ